MNIGMLKLATKEKKRKMIDAVPAHQEDESADDTASGDTALALVAADYKSFTVKQLREEIKSKGINIRGLAKMKKAELLSLLESS